MNTKQIIDEAERQLWLGDAEPEALHEHNKQVIAEAIEKAERMAHKEGYSAGLADANRLRAAHGTSAEKP